MSTQPIQNSLLGEHIVALFPESAQQAREIWQRRLNLFEGRTLSDTALLVEQEARAGHLALSGQMISSGVVRGLEVGLEAHRGEDGGIDFFTLSPGLGLAATGEDLVVSAPLRIPAREVPLYDPDPPIEGPGRLGSLIDAESASAGVLILKPIIIEEVGKEASNDPCEEDPRNYAFEDWQRIDGCRLLFYRWPAAWPLPPFGPTWRNLLAYTIFEKERENGSSGYLPWEEVGLAIGLVGCHGGKVQFIDGYSVVRSGGKGRRRALPAAQTGTPFLWQARMQQFAEQMAESGLGGTSIESFRTFFRFLPPAGLLPKEAITSVRAVGAAERAWRDRFFPERFLIEAAPVPLEELDLFLTESISLAPLDLSVPEPVRVLIPVPQSGFDPNLLLVEMLHPDFQEAIDRFVRLRTEWLYRREEMRRREEAIARAITGETPIYPRPDPERLEEESADPQPPFSSTKAHLSDSFTGLHQHLFTGATSPLIVQPGDRLTAYLYLDPDRLPREVMLQWATIEGWNHRAYWGKSLIDWGEEGTASRRFMGPLPASGEWVRLEVPAALVGLEGAEVFGMAFTLFDGSAAWAHAGKSAAGASPKDDLVWVGDTLPPGARQAVGNDHWTFIEANSLKPHEEEYQTAVAAGIRLALPLEELKAALRSATPVNGETTVFLAALPSSVTNPNGRLRYDAARRLLVFQGVMSETERDGFKRSAADASFNEAIDQLHTRSQEDELSRLDQVGLERFIDFLQEKINRADDTIDWGFLRIHSDIYRIRQLVLGNVAGTRLATSTTLASIATGETAAATRKDLETFIENAKKPVPTPSRAPQTSKAAPFVGKSNITGPIRRPAKAADFQISSKGIDLSQISVLKAETAVKPQIRLRRVDITEQAPIVGKGYDFRTVNIAERIKEAPAPEAKEYSVASKFEVIHGVARLDLNLDDLAVPGFLNDDPSDPTKKTEAYKTFAEIKINNFALANQVLAGLHDPDPSNGDEGHFVGAGVRALDHATAVMRAVEGRVAAYRRAVTLCQATLQSLQELADQIGRRLDVIGNALAESRHDVSVARALLAEETIRIEAINRRRDALLADVPFLAFCRPRTTALRMDAPIRLIDPGLIEAPVPACFSDDAAIPSDLRALIDLFRDAPVKWFTQIPPLLDRLDRLEILHGTLQYAKGRAQSRLTTEPIVRSTFGSAAGGLGRVISKVFTAQQEVVAQYRDQRADLDLDLIVGKSWLQSRERAKEIVSVGDLIDAGHGRSDLARRAAEEMEKITRISACLYAQFGEVLPILRLAWAESLSQYDAPVNLRNLASLARWGEVPLLARRSMQTLVDWLYQQVDLFQPDAVGLIHDLIRTCILLASHAPVNQILAGHVPQPTTVKEGSRVELAVDPATIRIGMQVLMYAGARVVARGIIEDLSAGKAAARVIKTDAPTVQLEQNARVQFAEPDRLGFIPMTRSGPR